MWGLKLKRRSEKMSKHCCNKHAGREAATRPWRRRLGLKVCLATALVGLLIGGVWMADWNAVPSALGGKDASRSARKGSAGAPTAQPGNQLAQEPSPYLREAAQQPVHWLPWGEAAFRRALQEDKPVLLDIGAVWCHWCHVMDVESYDNREIARLINEHFVAVKVDRDERPDVDRRYQQAVAAISGGGGWPLTAFLTPEGKVFYGGTYYPPEDWGGRPGLKTLLPKVAEVYKTRKAEVLASTEQLSSGLKRFAAESTKKASLSQGLVDDISTDMVRQFDSANGGFGNGVKFPAGSKIELALARYFVTRDPKMLEIVTKTLDAMASGGVYDQVGGGFFRYSTDPQWRVPHFEKMNYDNAELLVNYLHAYQATGKALYREIAQGIMGYLKSTLSDQANGGFYAHQDADMTREDDGDYYTWSVKDVRSALPKDQADVILRYYDVQPQGEMRENPDKNVLWIAKTPERIAKELGIPSDKVRALLARGKEGLLQARMKRKTPLVDRTIYSDRNGMLIVAYLEASQILKDDQAKAFALKTLNLLLREAYREGQGMYHAYFEGNARLPGLFNDQVQMANATLAAFQVTGEQRYLKVAKDLMDVAIARFWDSRDGAFFDRQPEGSALAALDHQVKDFEDDPVASANGVAAFVLDRLAYLTNDKRHEEKARQTLEAFAGSARRYGSFVAAYALAVHHALNRSAQAVIIGAKENPKTKALWTSGLTAYRPGKLVAVYDPTELKLESLPPAVAGAVKVFGVQKEPRAYVCAGTTCAPPTGDPSEVATLVKSYGVKTPSS